MAIILNHFFFKLVTDDSNVDSSNGLAEFLVLSGNIPLPESILTITMMS